MKKNPKSLYFLLVLVSFFIFLFFTKYAYLENKELSKETSTIQEEISVFTQEIKDIKNISVTSEEAKILTTYKTIFQENKLIEILNNSGVWNIYLGNISISPGSKLASGIMEGKIQTTITSLSMENIKKYIIYITSSKIGFTVNSFQVNFNTKNSPGTEYQASVSLNFYYLENE